MTPSIMTLSITTLSMITFSLPTISITTLIKMIPGQTIFSIMTFTIASINNMTIT